MMIRLQKYMADMGIASRRRSEEFIKKGKVFVNGEKAIIGMKVDPDSDEVKVFGKKLQVKSAHKVVYMFNKPKGVTSTTRHFKGEKNILSYFPSKYRLYPAGRLDKESRGLMIVTNDGDLANKLMHPSFKSEKEYIVTLDRDIDELSLRRLRKGIKYEGIQYKTISARDLGKKKLRIVLGEGKKRHIRMMLRACKYKVRDLYRKRINELEMGKLAPGARKLLTDNEIEKLLSPRR